MTSDVSDADAVEPDQARKAAQRSGGLDPGFAYTISTVLWMLMVVGMVRNPYFLPGDPGVPNARGVAWLYLGAVVLAIAIVAGLVYVVDQRRRRTHHPRGYRAPRKARPTVVEVLTGFFLFVYTLGVIAGVGWAAMLGYEQIVPLDDPLAWLIERAAFGPVILLAAVFHLIIVPVAGAAFLLNLRHKRQYPDPTHRNTPGFDRSTKTLLAVDVLLVLAIVAVEVLVPFGAIPG